MTHSDCIQCFVLLAILIAIYALGFAHGSTTLPSKSKLLGRWPFTGKDNTP
jgi:hypothetical protein